jgi:hypothetical protein
MPTSTLELIAIGQDMVAQLAHLPAAERLMVAHIISGLVFGEFDEDQHRALSDAACAEIVAALRGAAEEGVRP